MTKAIFFHAFAIAVFHFWRWQKTPMEAFFMSNIKQRTIQRLPAVKFASGYSRSTIYLRIAQGLWVRQVRIGARAVGWPSDEVEALNTARISGKSDDEIRALVIRLETARKSLA